MKEREEKGKDDEGEVAVTLNVGKVFDRSQCPTLLGVSPHASNFHCCSFRCC